MSVNIITGPALLRWVYFGPAFVLHVGGTIHAYGCGTITRSDQQDLEAVPRMVVQWLVEHEQEHGRTGRLCRTCMGAVVPHD